MARTTLSFFLLAFAVHCDGGTSGSPDANTLPDAGDGAVAYPAPHPAGPTIKSSGGAVIATPRIVPVVFEGDPLASTIGTFTKALHGSAFWKATTSEYGVGDVDVADLVVVPASDTVPGAIVDDAAIQAFLLAHLDGSHAGFGTADPSTIYALFYPPSTTVTSYGAASCTAFSGYHLQVSGSTTPITYVVVPRCASNGMAKGTDAITSTASHELIEAATDPAVLDAPAFNVPDDDHVVYTTYPLAELADMCSGEAASYYADPQIGFTVQRSWSNLLAAGGGSPCAPVPPNEVYYAAAPVLPETVTGNFTATGVTGLGNVQTKGVTVKLGETKTIEVDVFSSAPTPLLHIWVNDLATLYKRPAELDLQFDDATGVNGDKRQLTITRLRNNSTYVGTPIVLFTGPDLDHLHITVGFVAQ